MDYATLIRHYGYIATFVGTILEGETLLILSGLAAHRGYLSFPLVVLTGAIGGALGDLGFFLLGRHYGPRLIARFPRFAPTAHRVHAMVQRHAPLAIVTVRFMYGLRAAGPAIIGSTRIPIAEFALFNLMGAIAWSACWTGAGWVLGKAAERILGDLARVERELFLVAIVVVGLGALAAHLWRHRDRRSAASRTSTGE